MFLRNITIFFENIKVYTYGGISLHVYTHQVTRIYASSYTYVRMSLHVYMS